MNENENRWRVYRATFDTNLFVRTLIRKGNLPNYLLSLWETGRFVLVLSQVIIDEVQKVLSRPKMRLKHHYTLDEVANLIDLLSQASVIEITSSFELCRDASDNKFVECVILGRAHFLVSYDNDLIDDAELKQALFEFGVEIVDPPIFLEKIQET
ncbi:MAG: putative toxin-antitoxin system toxin component, PIN family [Candidatus Poribacteria bacterium]|nr:putative toxin-antitoxin system toxin component, PIN family [Candidatus Poribacteria bacterium]